MTLESAPVECHINITIFTSQLLVEFTLSLIFVHECNNIFLDNCFHFFNFSLNERDLFSKTSYDDKLMTFIDEMPSITSQARSVSICFWSQIFPFTYCVECNRSLGSFSRYNRSCVAKQEFYFFGFLA